MRKPFRLSGYRSLTVLLIILLMLSGCNSPDRELTMKNYKLNQTMEILVTSEEGDKLKSTENVKFRPGKTDEDVVITIYPDSIKQTMDGIGSSFTEASAFVLAHLNNEKRHEVMRNIYGNEGANFSLARTHIGACDFTVKGKYSYAEAPGDFHLKHFSIHHDKKGFSKKEYPKIYNEKYDLIPMIMEALAIKAKQDDNHLRIIASAWTAPPWMKDIETWFIPGSPENKWQGTGGRLKKEYEPVYADYLIKYLKAYEEEGIPVWGITPVNEPHGNNGQWESMHFTPESQNDFIKKHLGPALKKSPFPHTRLLMYDQNRDGLENWADIIYSDSLTTPYLHGSAIHWYESTEKVYEDVLDRVHEKFPQFSIIHTEGCIDDLGKDAPAGIADPVKFKESNWFDNDSFWWNDNATDWAYTAEWKDVNPKDHPIYTPVHRYARNIIVSIDHWLNGWIDWNIVLDRNGGPNHVGNFCGAPIMIDTDTRHVYYTPIFYVLSQFSRTIRPGDRALQTKQKVDTLPPDALHACATINAQDIVSVQVLNTTKKPVKYTLQVGSQNSGIIIPANSVQTVRFKLNHRLPASEDLKALSDREDPFIKRTLKTDGTTHAISYGPYRNGQAPGVQGPSEDQILEDLFIIKKHWDVIRIYGADADAARILQVIEDYKIPLKVMLGIWLENETDNILKKEANVNQVKTGIELANRYKEIVIALNVGNETQVYWSGHKMDARDLVRYVRAVRQYTAKPVTTADDYNYWNKQESKMIARELDFIVAHIYPLWNGKTLSNAISWLDSTYDDLKKHHPDKEIWLGEIGWATHYNPDKKGPGEQGTLVKGKVNLNAQEAFLVLLDEWIRKKQVVTFLFEAFDEPWKGGGLNSDPDDIEKHWGVFYEDRTPKKSFMNFLNRVENF